MRFCFILALTLLCSSSCRQYCSHIRYCRLNANDQENLHENRLQGEDKLPETDSLRGVPTLDHMLAPASPALDTIPHMQGIFIGSDSIILKREIPSLHNSKKIASLPLQFAVLDTVKSTSDDMGTRIAAQPVYKTVIDVLIVLGLVSGFLLLFDTGVLIGLLIWMIVYGLILLLALINVGIRFWKERHFKISFKPYAILLAMFSVLALLPVGVIIEEEEEMDSLVTGILAALVPVAAVVFAGLAGLLLLIGLVYSGYLIEEGLKRD